MLLLFWLLPLLFAFIVMGNVMVVVRAAAAAAAAVASTVLKAYEIFVILSRFNFGDVT